jgi:hypothetical protein
MFLTSVGHIRPSVTTHISQSSIICTNRIPNLEIANRAPNFSDSNESERPGIDTSQPQRKSHIFKSQHTREDEQRLENEVRVIQQKNSLDESSDTMRSRCDVVSVMTGTDKKQNREQRHAALRCGLVFCESVCTVDDEYLFTKHRDAPLRFESQTQRYPDSSYICYIINLYTTQILYVGNLN